MQGAQEPDNVPLAFTPAEPQAGILLRITKDGAEIEWQPPERVLDLYGEEAIVNVRARLSQVRIYDGLAGQWRASADDVPASPAQPVDFRFNRRFTLPPPDQPFALPAEVRAMSVTGPDHWPIRVLVKGTLTYWSNNSGRVSMFSRDRGVLRLHVTRTSMRGPNDQPLPATVVPVTPQPVWCTAHKHPRHTLPDAQDVTGPDGAAILTKPLARRKDDASPMEVDTAPRRPHRAHPELAAQGPAIELAEDTEQELPHTPAPAAAAAQLEEKGEEKGKDDEAAHEEEEDEEDDGIDYAGEDK